MTEPHPTPDPLLGQDLTSYAIGVMMAMSRLLDRFPDSRPDYLALTLAMDQPMPDHLYAALDCLWGLSRAVEMTAAHWAAMADALAPDETPDETVDLAPDEIPDETPETVTPVGPLQLPPELQLMLDEMLPPEGDAVDRRARP
jgi:hypothetical protein